MIEAFIITLISLLIGFALGYFSRLTKEEKQTIKAQVKQKISSSKVGVIKPLTAQERNERENRVLKETNEAMTESLERIFKR